MRVKHRDTTGAVRPPRSGLGFDFSMAFQPIVNSTERAIFGYEALVRGPGDESAGAVFGMVEECDRYRFDQLCRRKAITVASRLGVGCRLCINLMPNALCRPEACVQMTLKAAAEHRFPPDRIVFEFTETEEIASVERVRKIVAHYKGAPRGFTTAIDDFGAGYAGLNLLADLRTDFVKVDMKLVRDIGASKARQAIVKGIVRICSELAVTVIAEGIESYEELSVLRSFGIELFQGYHFARPSFEALPEVPLSAFESRRTGAGGSHSAAGENIDAYAR